MSFLTTYSQHPVIIKSFTLQEIYKSIIDGAFFVPKFQRNYVWKPSMIVNLATSLIKGYPINSFVLMPKDLVALGLNPASPLNKYKDELSPNGYYVLDGQQRLTSIASIFVNKARNGYENPQTYYFDLVNMVSSHIKCDLLNQGLDILIEESESQKIEFITKKTKKDMEWRYLKCSDIFKPSFQKEFETFSENFIYALKNKVPELYQENIKFFEGNNNFFSQFNSLFNNLKKLRNCLLCY